MHYSNAMVETGCGRNVVEFSVFHIIHVEMLMFRLQTCVEYIIFYYILPYTQKVFIIQN